MPAYGRVYDAFSIEQGLVRLGIGQCYYAFGIKVQVFSVLCHADAGVCGTGIGGSMM